MPNLNFDFSGRVIVVTGAGKGLGRKLCLLLDEAGAHVVGITRSSPDIDSLKKDCSDRFRGFPCELDNAENVKDVFGKIGKIDHLVNNAGIAICKPLLDFPLDDFDTTMNVNARAVLHCTQLAAKSMLKHDVKGGSIVNISSQASLTALADHVAYCMSKAAVDMLTAMSALELGEKGIRVNSVNPTVVMTKMGRDVWGNPEKGQPMLKNIPLGRFCEEPEVCHAVMFYLSDEAAFCNASKLVLDGGLTLCKTLR